MPSKYSCIQERPTKCNICGGKVIYIQTKQGFARSKFIYKCTQCGASVGTHITDPQKALGLLGNAETKAKRRELHLWFDRLWQTHSERENYYDRLAKELGIEKDECHFAMLTDEELDKALEIVKKWWIEKFDI